LAKEFNNNEVGETLASEDNLLIGRGIEVNLAHLTNDPKMQNVKIKFKIKEVKDNKGYVELTKYFMLPTYIKRVVKPGREKVEDSFILMTKDKIKIRLKPLIVTKALTQNSVLSSLRNKTREFMNEYCKKNEWCHPKKGCVEQTKMTALQRRDLYLPRVPKVPLLHYG